MIVTKRVIISGLVQGVFFRAYTKENAEKNAVFGWVRNTSNGKVEAVFQGSEKSVSDMIQWCYKGSPSSNVLLVEAEVFETDEAFTSFSILHSDV